MPFIFNPYIYTKGDHHYHRVLIFDPFNIHPCGPTSNGSCRN